MHDGVALYTQAWRAPEPKATVILVHGIAEHSARYRHVGAYLASQGYTVQTLDLRGHGRSPGKRLLVRHLDEHRDDVATLLARVRQEEPDRPLFLLGHSMGGLIVTYYVLTQPPAVDGVILSAPALQLDNVSPLLIAVGRVIAKVAPALPMTKLEIAAISRDPAVVAENEQDPLVYHGGIPAAAGLALIEGAAYVQVHMEELALPLLILQGEADRLVSPEGSKQLYARAQSRDKSLKLYAGLYHELLNEPEKQQILDEICTWLEARVRGGQE